MQKKYWDTNVRTLQCQPTYCSTTYTCKTYTSKCAADNCNRLQCFRGLKRPTPASQGTKSPFTQTNSNKWMLLSDWRYAGDELTSPNILIFLQTLLIYWFCNKYDRPFPLNIIALIKRAVSWPIPLHVRLICSIMRGKRRRSWRRSHRRCRQPGHWVEWWISTGSSYCCCYIGCDHRCDRINGRRSCSKTRSFDITRRMSRGGRR